MEYKSEIVTRTYDGKHMLYAYIPDPNFVWEEYRMHEGETMNHLPSRWVILGVFDDQATALKQRPILLEAYDSKRKSA